MNSVLDVQQVLTRWAVTRNDEVVKNPKDGFYSFEIVHDAYLKGIEKGKDTLLEDFRQVYFDRLNNVGEYLNELFKFMQQNDVSPVSFFINHGFDNTKVIVSIAPELTYDMAFIEKHYTFIIDLQERARNINAISLSISFIENSEDINIELLESDGFDLQHTF